MARKHTEHKVLASLFEKKDVMVDIFHKHIKVLSPSAKNKQNDLGNKSWGKIDFLTHQQGYTLFFVKEF